MDRFGLLYGYFVSCQFFHLCSFPKMGIPRIVNLNSRLLATSRVEVPNFDWISNDGGSELQSKCYSSASRTFLSQYFSTMAFENRRVPNFLKGLGKFSSFFIQSRIVRVETLKYWATSLMDRALSFIVFPHALAFTGRQFLNSQLLVNSDL